MMEMEMEMEEFWWPQDVGVKSENPVDGQVYWEIDMDTWWVWSGVEWVWIAMPNCPTCHRPY